MLVLKHFLIIWSLSFLMIFMMIINMESFTDSVSRKNFNIVIICNLVTSVIFGTIGMIIISYW